MIMVTSRDSLSLDELNSLPTKKLEALCDEDMRTFLRDLCTTRKDYREAIIDFITRPRLPIKELLDAVRKNTEPSDAWKAALKICRVSASGAPWRKLPKPDLKGDIRAARHWLGNQLKVLPAYPGIYLGMDTLNMRDGLGHNVEIGVSASCDPTRDSIDWIQADDLVPGSNHLISGLCQLQKEYSRSSWQIADEKVSGGNYFSFADYSLFLAYSGIVLAQALKLLKVTCQRLAIWGFHDGDLFLLARKTPKNFTLLCKEPVQRG